MDKQTDETPDRGTNTQIEVQRDKSRKKWKYYRQMDRQIQVQRDRGTDRRTERQTNRRYDRQMNRLTYETTDK
jgi:hypothetical protein